MPKWEYLTWSVYEVGDRFAVVAAVNGQEIAEKEQPSLYEALARAGEEGWELVTYDRNASAMIFKRPLVEAEGGS